MRQVSSGLLSRFEKTREESSGKNRSVMRGLSMGAVHAGETEALTSRGEEEEERRSGSDADSANGD